MTALAKMTITPEPESNFEPIEVLFNPNTYSISKSVSWTAATGNSQQEKMKTCNADATTKGLKGTERKAFMKECLSGSAAH